MILYINLLDPVPLLTPFCRPTCSTKCLIERFLPLCNSIIRASVEKGSPQKALLDYKALLLFTAFRPDYRTLALVVGACRTSSNLPAAMEAHARILKTGFQSHGPVATPLFQSYLDHGRVAEALPMFDEVLKWDSDPFHGNLLIMALSKNGEIGAAYRVFRRMPVCDLVSWNSMIAGCVRGLRPKEAMSLFSRMVGMGIQPDGFSFSAVLSACARVGARSYGEWVHRLIPEKEVEFNHILGSALIDMYAKCGRIEVAKEIFAAIRRDKVSVWNSMLTGLAIHGLGPEAIQVFSRMEKESATPDAITFVGVLTACSHCGMVEEARRHFDVMKGKYSIEPRVEHYGAMVDSLARAGLLDEAHETVKRMPMEPDAVIWRALLSACRRHQRTELAELAIGQMARWGSGDYVLLSSIYSSTKRWDHAERVWELMKERKVRKKNRGLSSVELGSRIHQFKAGDRTHPESDGIYRVLRGLMKRVKAEGFTPMTELVAMDVSEEEREENLSCHSEKLAVAYSVLKTAPAAEIMVSKNLQTCGDCHEWMKAVSKVLGRVIMVRDRVRFHRFQKGACSCRDYW